MRKTRKDDPMTIDYPQVLERRTEGEGAWTNQETILYALGVGMGADPMDEKELAFVFEKDLKALPTFASVIRARPTSSTGPEARMQLNPVLIVDGERNITFHKPIPAAAKVKSKGRVLGVFDKGKDKGAVVVNETIITDEAGDPIATIHASIFARGDGGFGGPSEGQPEPHAVPTRAPDRSIDIVTRPDQALIYRLSGDRNPLHSDPWFAKEMAGFPKPILHGLCTYGVAGRALVAELGNGVAANITSIASRFTSPVFPGETLTTLIWRTEPDKAVFRTVVDGADGADPRVVLDDGVVEFVKG
jgi:acyl dehydratase